MLFSIFIKTFIVHIVLVIIASGLVIYTKTFYAPPDESFFVWAVFLLIDFPSSIVIMLTSGPTVVSLPEYLGSDFRHWIFEDVVWPGLCFLVIGTFNWTFLLYVINWSRST